jgi:hypothetical protein
MNSFDGFFWTIWDSAVLQNGAMSWPEVWVVLRTSQVFCFFTFNSFNFSDKALLEGTKQYLTTKNLWIDVDISESNHSLDVVIKSHLFFLVKVPMWMIFFRIKLQFLHPLFFVGWIPNVLQNSHCFKSPRNPMSKSPKFRKPPRRDFLKGALPVTVLWI